MVKFQPTSKLVIKMLTKPMLMMQFHPVNMLKSNWPESDPLRTPKCNLIPILDLQLNVTIQNTLRTQSLVIQMISHQIMLGGFQRMKWVLLQSNISQEVQTLKEFCEKTQMRTYLS